MYERRRVKCRWRKTRLTVIEEGHAPSLAVCEEGAVSDRRIVFDVSLLWSITCGESSAKHSLCLTLFPSPHLTAFSTYLRYNNTQKRILQKFYCAGAIRLQFDKTKWCLMPTRKTNSWLLFIRTTCALQSIIIYVPARKQIIVKWIVLAWQRNLTQMKFSG